MLREAPGEVTALLQRMRSGDASAAEVLVPLVLSELHALARFYLRGERKDHTLQPTALVNEAYIRLVGGQARDWKNRAHFIGVTASVMRRVLVDYARKTNAAKRGGPERSPLDVPENLADLEPAQCEEVIALDTALDRLEKMSPRQKQVVEMRYFGGLSLEETAEALGVSEITVKRDWIAARAWLKHQIRPGTPG